MPQQQEKKCELILDHTPVWDGSGYSCSRCGLGFRAVSPTPLTEEVEAVAEIVQTPNGISVRGRKDIVDRIQKNFDRDAVQVRWEPTPPTAQGHEEVMEEIAAILKAWVQKVQKGDTGYEEAHAAISKAIATATQEAKEEGYKHFAWCPECFDALDAETHTGNKHGADRFTYWCDGCQKTFVLTLSTPNQDSV